jgi:hypothetical protein
MSNYNSIATPMELDANLSKLEGGEAIDSNNYWSMISSLRYLTCTRSDISFYGRRGKSVHGGLKILIFESSKEDPEICQEDRGHRVTLYKD